VVPWACDRRWWCHDLIVIRVVVMTWVQVLCRVLIMLRSLVQVILLLLLLLLRVIDWVLVRA